MKNRCFHGKFIVRLWALCMAFVLAFSLFPVHNLQAVEAAETAEETEMIREVIEINNPEDFLAFAKHCSLDTWSADKQIVLNADIDLSDTGFESLPVFAGVFDGRNHTISGYQYSGGGYVAGLFRHIEKNGLVENLKLRGEIPASDEKECIGSLCGANYGTIRNCSFQGNVSGKTAVGGLAGVNGSTGEIWDCFVGGRVTGYYSTGGIVGRNHGTVGRCVNRACVNNDSEWVEEADGMGIGPFLPISVTDWDITLFSGVDSGGVAGYSDGVVIGCRNEGIIGYEHIGYNIGGIAGRQSGVVSLCTNAGTVYGRKDVGGVVGQMEPYIEVDEAQSLRNEVNKLHDLIEKTIEDMGNEADVLKNDLDDLMVYADGTLDTGDTLAGQIAGFLDDNLEEAQEVGDRLDHAMEMLPGVFDDVEAAQEKLSKAIQALGRIGGRLENLADSLGSSQDTPGVQEGLVRLTKAQERLNKILQDIDSNGNVSAEKLQELLDALGELSDAITDVMDSLNAADIWQKATDGLNAAGGDLTDAANHLQQAYDFIKRAFRDARSIVDYLNGQEDIRFSKLGTEFDTNRGNLLAQLQGMSDCIKILSDDTYSHSDVVMEDMKAVNDQINLIFNLLADSIPLLGEEISINELYEDLDIKNPDDITSGKVDNCVNRGSIKGDINVGGIAGAMSIDMEDPEDSAAGSVEYQIGRKYFTQCFLTDCINEGFVTAKKDGAGGIVGYMRCGTVTDSEGYGSVESTEGNYAGGICGESLTVVRRCYALCTVSGGRNVGGIAGCADTLKDCYALVDCHGTGSRIGVVAGQTVHYEEEYDGEETRVSGNYYVESGLHGIDNISYAGMAEPISYEELLRAENIPVQFRHLKVIFRVDDLYLGTQEIPYGESLATLEYPSIPEMEGYYGVWPDYSDRVMECSLLITGEYKEDVTVVQSNGMQTGESGEEGGQGREKPYALVEHRFTEATVLKVGLSDVMPPEQVRSRAYVIYDVTLEQSEICDTDTFAIRLYNPYGRATVWGCKNGVWTELESKTRGEYLQVDMTGTEEMFCVAGYSSGMWVILGGIAGGAAVIALLSLAARKLHAKHRVKNSSTKKAGN